MDVRDFIKKQESALKRYRRVYKLLDFITILIILYTIMVVLSVDQILPLIDSLEVRVGTSYELAGISIPFENMAMLLIALLPALILTLLLHTRGNKTSVVLRIEEKYPDLRERLRTAYDNFDDENVIVDDLEQKVSVRVSQVDPFALLSRRLLLIAMMGLLLSSISVTYVTIYDVRIVQLGTDEWQDIIDDLPFAPENSNTGDLAIIDEEGDGQEGNGNEDLTGEPTVVVVDGEEVDLSLPPGTGTGFNPNDEAEEIIEDFEDSPGGPPTVTPSGTYSEELPEGYETVIRDYFEQLAEE